MGQSQQQKKFMTAACQIYTMKPVKYIQRKLQNIISTTDWNDVLGKTVTNESYDQFIRKFTLIYDDCFPIKVKEIKTVRKIFEKEVHRK